MRIVALEVLVTTSGGTGHLHPMVPLARALVVHGHELLWAPPDRSVPQVEGDGISLGSGELSAAAVQDAVRQLLHQDSFRRAAAQVGRSIAVRPSPDEVCQVLERLA